MYEAEHIVAGYYRTWRGDIRVHAQHPLKHQVCDAIVEASLDDAEAILSLQKRAYQSEAAIYGDYNIPPLTQTLEQLTAEFNDQVFLKAVSAGIVVGSVRAQRIDDVCHIGRLVVDPEFQGQGLGKGLMRAIEHHFCDVTRFDLFTGHKSARNLRLYRQLGYAVLGRKTISPDLDFVFLSKRNRAAGV